MARQRLWLLCCASLAAAAAAAAAGGEPPAGDAAAWEEDEACPAGTPSEACALSLRQLRARGVSAPPAAAVAAAHEPPAAEPAGGEPAPADEFVNSSGVPGGWGEAASYADFLIPDAGIQPAGRWGSCQRYGCHGHYHRHFSCQCNPGCQRYGNCCADYWSKCQSHPKPQPKPAPAPPPSRGHKKNIQTLFHQTSEQACQLILKSNFRPGTQGWCGGGIYFATSAEATETKAIGPDSHKGCILEARVDVGKIWYLSPTCNRGLHGTEVWNKGYDSVSFDPGDGQEYIVYRNSQVLSIKRYR